MPFKECRLCSDRWCVELPSIHTRYIHYFERDHLNEASMPTKRLITDCAVFQYFQRERQEQDAQDIQEATGHMPPTLLGC